MRATLVVATVAVLLSVGVSPPPSPAIRFDELIRDDFFAGVAGDQARLDQGMQICEQALAVNPDHAPALVWHGAGSTVRGGAVFRAGDRPGALTLVERGLAEMERAVRLAPDEVSVLIPRAATLLRLAEIPAFADRAPTWLEAAVANYEHVLALHGPTFAQRPEHARGELLGGIAEGLDRLGKTETSRAYLRRIVTDVPGSTYETRAQAWLSGPNGMARPRLTCVGCHME